MSVTRDRVLFVGESNPYGEDERYALYDEPSTSAGGRFRRKVLGVHRRTYFGERVERVNLCSGWWEIKTARAAANKILTRPPNVVLVMLGRAVAKGFDLEEIPVYGSKQLTTGHLVVALPHPSGLNREWAKPDAVTRARAALKAACPWLPLGEADASPAPKE